MDRHAPAARLGRLAVSGVVATLLLALLPGPGGATVNGSTATATGTPTATGTATDRLPLVEATVAEVQAALLEGSTTCVEVVTGYLDRIAAYDDAGPALRSVIATSPTALEVAAALDDHLADTGELAGPLHCATVLLKDNVDTGDQATTGGSRSLAVARPPDDAFLVAGLRRAGAVVLGKANMDEFAFGFGGSSSLGGQVRNPYDPARGPGGSSSGTGASVAASLAMAGVGSDTGGSIRVPSSVQGLVGIRPSMRLVSQDGVIPLAHFQDTAGPMCRTVQDCALMLDAMVGFDGSAASGQHTQPMARDAVAEVLPDAQAYAELTGITDGHTFTDALDPAALDGGRIGVVRALFGSDPDVTAVMAAAIDAMRAAGATVEDVTIRDLSTITGYASVSASEFRDHLTEYLMSWPSLGGDMHKQTFEQVAVSLEYETGRAPTFALYGVNGHTRDVDPAYARNTDERTAFVRPRIQAALDNTDLGGTPLGQPFDALLYPSVLSPPRVGGAPSTGSNNRLSPFTGFPALSMPAGFTAATEARVALPIGMELLGREFAEGTLLGLAFAYQEAVAGTALARRAPTTTPELGGPAASVTAAAPAGGLGAPRVADVVPTWHGTEDVEAMAVDELRRQ